MAIDLLFPPVALRFIVCILAATDHKQRPIMKRRELGRARERERGVDEYNV